jgi:hypothetical protein
MGSPLKHKSLRKGAKVPWRLHFQSLRMAFFHAHLRKVTVMLLVDRETRLDRTQNENSFFCRRCLYVVCAQNRLELTTRSANRSFWGVAQTIDFDKKSIVSPCPVISKQSSDARQITSQLLHIRPYTNKARHDGLCALGLLARQLVTP